MKRLMIMHNILRIQGKKNSNMSIIVKYSNSTPGIQKQSQINLYTLVRKELHPLNNICVFKHMAKVLMLHSVKNYAY